jgi:hypothetical protein
MELVAILVNALTGLLLMRALWPTAATLRWEQTDWLRLALGLWCSLGLSSVASFGAQMVSAGNRWAWITADIFLCLIAGIVWLALGRKGIAATRGEEPPAWPVSKWAALTALVVVGAGYLLMAFPRQTGEIDAWSIWNMKARFLYRGATFQTMADSLLDWIHPEFPYLLPSLSLRTWHWAGEETFAGPMLTAAAFVVSMMMGMYGAVWTLRAPTQGFLALAALAGSSGFVGNGAVQYADFPLACFLFGSLAATLVAERFGLSRLAAVAGLCAGFAAWTKYEGSFYAVALLSFALWRLRRTALLPFVAGAIPGVGMLVYFKARIAPAVPAGISADPVALLLAVASKLLTFSFLGWVVSPFLVLGVYLYCCGVAKDRRPTWFPLLGLFAAGSLAVVLRDDNAGDAAAIRLLLHLWPATLLAVFIHANTPEELMAIPGKITPKASRK